MSTIQELGAAILARDVQTGRVRSATQHLTALRAAVVELRRSCDDGADGQIVASLVEVMISWLRLAVSTGGGTLIAVEAATAHKYGRRLCFYCNQNPCVCPRQRRQPPQGDHAKNPVLDGLARHLKMLQIHLGTLYRHNQSPGRGPAAVLAHLGLELHELQAVLDAPLIGQMSWDHWVRDFGGELADVLAWLLAAANLAGVDMATALSGHLEQM